MNRAAPWLLALVLALVVGVWASRNLERYTVWRWQGPEGDAARPYYVAQQLLSRLGHPVGPVRTALDLQQLPPQRVLIYDGAADSTQAEALARWVARGGHLILALGYREDDALADAFGVSLSDTAPRPGSPEGASCRASPTSPLQGPPLLAGLRVDWEPDQQLTLSEASPLRTPLIWHDDGGARVLHARYGDGAVTVLPGLAPFRQGYAPYDRPIATFDHATLLARLVALDGPGRRVAWLGHLEDLSLWGWLIRHAAPVLLAAAVCLLLWLWRVVPRFGPVQPDAPPARRSLLGHLTAAGRLWWTCGAHEALLGAARERVRQSAIRRHPQLAGLPAEAWPGALAELTHWPSALLSHSLTATPRNRRDALAALSALERLYRRFA